MRSHRSLPQVGEGGTRSVTDEDVSDLNYSSTTNVVPLPLQGKANQPNFRLWGVSCMRLRDFQ